MDWAAEEMHDIEFGDKRLNKRLIKLLDCFSKDPNASIPLACQDWSDTKAAYRFFENKKVTLDKILLPHQRKTISRIQQEKRILMIQDTTEINYTGQSEKQGVGPSHFENEQVLFLHPTIAVTPNKMCVGITNIFSWHREELQRNVPGSKKRATHRLHHQDISEKESYRWLLGYRHATNIATCCPDTHIIMVADRESDIADIYHEAWQTEGKKADWLIRAKITNRVVLNENGERDPLLLYDKLRGQKKTYQIKFTLPRRDKKPSRVVKQSLKTLRVQIHPPTGRRGKLRLQPCWITAILAEEINPPTGEKPLTWLLLTSIQLNHEIQAHNIIQWYLCRWQIEVFFYILKSGCKVEELQLTTPDRFMPCLGLYCIVAWRILLLTHLAREKPQDPCESLFTRAEWKLGFIHVYKKPPPRNPITLAEMTLIVARLGGFLARKSDKDPGPKTIWLGLKKLDVIVEQHNIEKNFTDYIYG